MRGQLIIVDSASKLVMVQTAVHPQAVYIPSLREAGALWGGLVRQLGS